jgi:formylglycine-generating enzyme
MSDAEEPKRPAPGGPAKPLPRLWKYAPDDEPEDEYALKPEPDEFELNEDGSPKLDEAGKPKKKARPTNVALPPRPMERSRSVEKSPPAEKPKRGEKSSAIDRGATPVKSPSTRESEKASKPAKRPRERGEEKESKKVLVEETPEYDTYEARQRVRIVVGVVLAASFLFIGYSVIKSLIPAAGPDETAASGSPDAADPALINAPVVDARTKAEEEAKLLFKHAEEVARSGKVEMAVQLLKKVTASYPGTRVALLAQQALDRPKRNLPLFLDTPAVVASPSDVKPPPVQPVKAPTAVVDATRPTVPTKPESEANLVLPANAAEPGMPTPNPAPAPSPGTPSVSFKPLPHGFRPREGTNAHASGWPMEIVGLRDGAPMMLVPGGAFIQGRDDGESAEGPAHNVTLGTYYIDRHEVTNRQFDLFQKEAGKRSERVRALAKDPALAKIEEPEDAPVVMVSARDAADYASWANKKLPTEAQWEAAARTPDGRIYPWGPDKPVWSKPKAPRQIDPVMSFPQDASPYGVFDLAGNAWEWTKDWYEARYYQQFRTTSADNPAGPSTKPRSGQLVVKGASRDWFSTRREPMKFDARLPYLGFRCVLQVEGAGNAFDPTPSASAPARGGPAGSGSSDTPF